MKILSFDQALDESARYKKRHLLVGNGFSIAWRREIFTYGALFERADFKNLSTRARSAFEALDTTDFEQVIRGLQTSAALAELFGVSSEVVQEMNEVAASLRELLVTTIATSHPDNPSVLDESELSTCSRFLNHFNTVYSINYDLLLYWVGMHLLDNIPMEKRRLAFDDGFRTPENGDKPDYVTWDIHKTDPQTIYYLHGTLHLFDAGYELQKFTWVNTGIRLIDQTREALAEGKFPVFVAEGSSQDKLTRINHSSYLSRGLRSFAHIGGSLFVFGHSFADNDSHIL